MRTSTGAMKYRDMANKRKRKKRPRTKISKSKASTGDRRWAKIEIDFLKEGFQPQKAAAIARTLNRPVPSVRQKAAELEVCHTRAWTDWDLQYLVDHYHTMEPAGLAQRLCRRVEGIIGKAHVLMLQGQLDRKTHPCTRWTPAEIAILKRSKRTALSTLAKKLSRTERAIDEKRKLLGLHTPVRTLWTAEEVEFIKANHKRMTRREMAEHLGRPKHAVNSKLSRLGLQSAPPEAWEASETTYLKKQLSDPDHRMTYRELAEHLGRTEHSVRWKAERLKLTTSQQEKAWRPREIHYLKKHYKHKMYRDIGAHLGRSDAAVEKRLHLLGLRKRASSNPVPWRPQEIRYLKKHYKRKTYREIGAHLGRSEASVDKQIRLLGLRKRSKNNQVPWGPEEIAYLKKHYRKYFMKELAVHLNRSFSSVQSKLRHLGLLKRYA